MYFDFRPSKLSRTFPFHQLFFDLHLFSSVVNFSKILTYALKTVFRKLIFFAEEVLNRFPNSEIIPD